MADTELELTGAARSCRYSRQWCELFGLALVLLIGLVLRVQHLADVHSWFDESLGWRMAQFSPTEIIARSEQNVHPPMHFLLLHCWAALFGNSLIALRCYSVLWGQLAVLGAFALARDAKATSGKPSGESFAALFAALLVAINPLHVNWSQQIKMYSLGTCTAVWSTWFLLSWFRTQKPSHLFLYVPVAAILALQHHYGVFTVFAQLTFALIWATYRWRKGTDYRLMPVVLAAWATATLWSLWLPSFLIQRNLVQDGYWIRNFDWQSTVDVWAQLLSSTSHSQPSLPIAWATAEAVWIVIALLLTKRDPGIRLLGWLVFVPYFMAVIWSFVFHNVLVARFLIFAQVFLLIGCAVLIGQIRFACLRWILATLATVGVCWTAQARWSQRNAEASVPGMPFVVSTLKELRSNNESVQVCNPMLYLNLLAHGSGLNDVYTFDPGHRFPHFQGTPVMSNFDYCDAATLNRMGNSWVWTLDAEEWLGRTWKVELQPEWKLQDERRIREWYAVLILRLYHRDLVNAPKQ